MTHTHKHRASQNHKVHQIEESRENPNDDDFLMYSVGTCKDENWTVKLFVNEAKSINFKIDTVAQCNVMSLKTCKHANIDTKQLMRSKVNCFLSLDTQ